MKLFVHPLRYVFLLPLLLLLATACGDDDYHYPDARLEYLTAYSGADGRLTTVLADDGTQYDVLNSVYAPNEAADTTLRIVANYTRETDVEGRMSALLYAAQTAISPVPLPADRFEDGVKADPASVLSIWMGLDYLNLVLEIKTADGGHAFHFVEDEVSWDDATARREVALSLYHDAGDDPQYYTRWVYLSVPLRQYAADDARTVSLRFSLNNYEDEEETYTFEYVPEND